jgi:antitoxin HicB
MMRYPIKLRRDGEHFLVTFPDIPEAITQGETQEEALEQAMDALETALDFYFDAGRIVPEPSPLKKKQPFVELPVSISAKVLLLNEMLRQKVRPAELARRLKTTPQEVNRLVNIRHTSKIDGIASALKALGKTLQVTAMSDAA